MKLKETQPVQKIMHTAARVDRLTRNKIGTDADGNGRRGFATWAKCQFGEIGSDPDGLQKLGKTVRNSLKAAKKFIRRNERDFGELLE